MKKTVSIFAALSAALMLAVFPARIQAQTTINTTTLSGAATATATTVSVTSASTMAVGQQLYVDREVMVITAINGTQISVTRGMSGTTAMGHVSGRVVYSGAPNYFTRNTPQGSCTSTDVVYYPVINVNTGEFTNCKNSLWQTTTYYPLSPAAWPRTPVSNANYTVLPTDVVVSYTLLTAGRTLTLPTLTGQPARILILMDEGGYAGSYTVTIVGTINGQSTGYPQNYLNSAYAVKRLWWTGSAWVVW